MATADVQIGAIADIILAQFGGDPVLFNAAMARLALTTQLEALQSQLRNEQAARDAAVTASESDIQAIQAQITAKQQEIDALEA